MGLMGSSETSFLRKRNRKGAIRVSKHTVWFTDEAEIAVKKLNLRERNESSTYRELWAIYFMIWTFIDRLKGSSILIQCDNQCLYWILKKGSSSALSIHTLLIRLFWFCHGHDLILDLIWIPRELNQWADDLSKQVDVSDWTVTSELWHMILETFGPFSCDRFSSAENACLPTFCSLVHSPEVSYVNAFARDWTGGKSWCHPPVNLIGEVIEKIRSERVKATVLVPAWTSAWWWLRLCPDGRHFGHWVLDYRMANSRTDLILGEGSMPRSMKGGCALYILDLDGASLKTSSMGPVAGFCVVRGCDLCNGLGSWL